MPRGKAAKSLHLIDAAYGILEEIQPATVRAVCYRLFVLRLIDNMAKNNTNRVSVQLVYAREKGLIPWSWIVDETREAERPGTWKDPERFADAVKASYRRDRWAQQPRRVEVWSEKGTVRGTLAPVLRHYGVTFRVLHGYSSSTTVNQVAQETADLEAPTRALYVGDWDPSGLNMSEVDLPTRLDAYGAQVVLQRIALSLDDVVFGDLPWFSAEEKRQDSRYGWFVARYGHRCWELDALSPAVLRDRVVAAIRDLIDVDAWERCNVVEAVEQRSLLEVMRTWKALAS